MAKVFAICVLLLLEAAASTMTISGNPAKESVVLATLLIAAASSLPTVLRLADHLSERLTGANN